MVKIKQYSGYNNIVSIFYLIITIVSQAYYNKLYINLYTFII